MPTRVHILARRPLTPEAIAEFVALPTGPPVGNDFEALDVELARRGWDREHELVCDSFRLSCAPELPPAADEKALEAWITAHIDW
ncbi:hypothetical protein ACIPYR_04665 [Streptomyces parvus]|uniref:hypothetical protein n=1 Tax=Streptomyces parvus TaxID=66428 RepID=UPI0038249537